jgi:oligopeptide/dipeptide ABC transporter ATP-binding protein
MNEPNLLTVMELKKHFPIRAGVFGSTAGWVRAVDGVSFSIPGRGGTFGVAGESGCGKTTLGKVVLRLIEPTSGSILFDGRDLARMRAEDLRRARRDMQIVFQDPYWSLNPRMTVRDIVAEPIEEHARLSRREIDERVNDLLQLVGLNPRHRRNYPHEFSGGQRQRIGIARALALNPKFLVLDEPTSALDVSVQAQILNLLEELKEQFCLTYLLISHDLMVMEHMASTVAIMYLGRIVEMGPSEDLLEEPFHPYTQALISAVPVADPAVRRQRIVLEGAVPSAANPPPGCRFHPRCRFAEAACRETEPKLLQVNGRRVACHVVRGD